MANLLEKLPLPVKKTNEERRQESTEKIIQATIDLFSVQGYEKTTMRQIAAKACILNGSLYNIFESKEDIFNTILERGYDSALEASKKLISDNDNIILALAFPLAIDLHVACSSERGAEFIMEAHSSWKVTNMLVDKTQDWMMSYFEKYNADLDKDVIRVDLLALFGSLGNLVSMIHHEGLKDYKKEMKLILELFCTVFRIPAFGIEKIVDDMVKVLDENVSIIGAKVVMGDTA